MKSAPTLCFKRLFLQDFAEMFKHPVAGCAAGAAAAQYLHSASALRPFKKPRQVEEDKTLCADGDGTGAEVAAVLTAHCAAY